MDWITQLPQIQLSNDERLALLRLHHLRLTHIFDQLQAALETLERAMPARPGADPEPAAGADQALP